MKTSKRPQRSPNGLKRGQKHKKPAKKATEQRALPLG